jgi:hypothetical protein
MPPRSMLVHHVVSKRNQELNGHAKEGSKGVFEFGFGEAARSEMATRLTKLLVVPLRSHAHSTLRAEIHPISSHLSGGSLDAFRSRLPDTSTWYGIKWPIRFMQVPHLPV